MADIENTIGFLYRQSDQNRSSQDIAFEQVIKRIWTPLSIRCRFWKYDESSSDGEELNDITVSVKPGPVLDEYKTRIYDAHRFGYGNDLNLVWKADELGFFSGWTYNANDALVIEWPNPGNIAWALSISLGFYLR